MLTHVVVGNVHGRDEVIFAENSIIGPAFDLIMGQIQMTKFREVEERIAIYGTDVVVR